MPGDPVRISVRHDQIEAAARLLYDAGVTGAVIEPTGIGWIIELLQPAGSGLAERARAAGFKVLER